MQETIFELTREKTILNILQSLTLNKITLKILKEFIYHYLKFTSCFNENAMKYILYCEIRLKLPSIEPVFEFRIDERSVYTVIRLMQDYCLFMVGFIQV